MADKDRDTLAGDTGPEGTPDRRTGHLPAPRSTEARVRRVRAAKDAPRKFARTFIELKSSVNPTVLAVAVLVLAAVVVSVATPMRNYFEQRAELATLNATIEQQEAEKQTLTEDIEKYRSEAYLKEQVRTRLGLIEPGETAYRLLDPKITSGADYVPGDAPDAEDTTDPWYTRLWDAIATPPTPEPGAEDVEVPPAHGESPNLPVIPDPAPE